MKLFAALFFVLALGTASAQHTVTESWAWPASYTPLPACSSVTPALTANCGQTWTVEHTAGSTALVVDTSTLAWGTLTFTEPVPANNTAPTWNFTVFASYLDATGAQQNTAQATCGSANTVPPCATTGIPNTVPGPVNFTVTVK